MVPPAEAIVAILAQGGLPAQFELTALPGGANNRVYRIDGTSGPLLLKAYFHHPDDPRDRLGAEFSFSRFAWQRGLRCLPQPLAADHENQLGLYEFIEGQAPSLEDLGMAEVQQAVDFYRELNRHKNHTAARDLRPGSEACFTLKEHLFCVERRLGRLLDLDASLPLGREAEQLVRQELVPLFERVRQHVLAEAGPATCDTRLAAANECLSPSDFGFHNAIRAADGRLRFVDFEYAGWDDPAKTVCDFFCQPAVPVPLEFWEYVVASVVSDLDDPEGHQRRIALLLPVYQLKWCCIMLNDFLPVESRRRAFARDSGSEEARKETQLHKTRRSLEQIRVLR